MTWVYFKIALSLAIPFATLNYARQVRIDRDLQAVKWDVQHPPELQWVVDHPRESLQANRAEAKYLCKLLRDVGN